MFIRFRQMSMSKCSIVLGKCLDMTFDILVIRFRQMSTVDITFDIDIGEGETLPRHPHLCVELLRSPQSRSGRRPTGRARTDRPAIIQIVTGHHPVPKQLPSGSAAAV